MLIVWIFCSRLLVGKSVGCIVIVLHPLASLPLLIVADAAIGPLMVPIGDLSSSSSPNILT
jgi:hypothetical protein